MNHQNHDKYCKNFYIPNSPPLFLFSPSPLPYIKTLQIFISSVTKYSYAYGHTKAIKTESINCIYKNRDLNYYDLEPNRCNKQSLMWCGGRKNMFEKLLLAVTITFSLNLCLHIREPDKTNTGAIQRLTEASPTILVTIFKK